MHEKLHELWEDTDKKLQGNRIPHQDRFKDEDYARGAVLHSNELIRRVRNMNAGIWAEDSLNSPGFIGFYYHSPKTWERTFTGAYFPRGLVRQRVKIKTDTADLPTGYTLGWQQVLNRLLRLRLITYEQIKKQFPIFETELSREFYQQLQEDLWQRPTT